MPRRKRPRRPIYLGALPPRLSRQQRVRIFLYFLMVALLALLVVASLYFREVTGRMALSDSVDMVTLAVNEIVSKEMSENDYGYSYFVTLERDNEGNVCAISTNVGRINALSSSLLSRVINAANSGGLDLRIPLGNLLGSNLLLGRGPKVPVKISMLTTSRADFKNELISAGINQTKHQILLEMTVDIDVVLPWQMLSTQVVTEVLVAETIIVGRVPETYLNWGG